MANVMAHTIEELQKNIRASYLDLKLSFFVKISEIISSVTVPLKVGNVNYVLKKVYTLFSHAYIYRGRPARRVGGGGQHELWLSK
jgi:hypothetical protein